MDRWGNEIKCLLYNIMNVCLDEMKGIMIKYLFIKGKIKFMLFVCEVVIQDIFKV